MERPPVVVQPAPVVVQQAPVVLRRDEPPRAPELVSRPPPELQKRMSTESFDDDRRPKMSRQDSGPPAEGGKDDVHEHRHRDVIRAMQNEGTAAYQEKDYHKAQAAYDRALIAHQAHIEAPMPSGRPPSNKVHVDRDKVKAKLLGYLSRSLEKLGDEKTAEARKKEAMDIEARLSEYERKKEEHRRKIKDQGG